MNVQTFFKGLGMALISVIIAYFSTTPIDFVMMAVAAVSAVLVYTGKNLIAVLNSTSSATALNWINAVSGLLIAVGTAIFNYVGQYLINDVIDWTLLIKMVLGVSLTYLGSVFFSPPSRESKKLFK